jgi:cytochrome c553
VKLLLSTLLLNLLWLITPNVLAIEKITIKLDFVPNLESGKNLFGICARCHLPEAWGNEDGTYPQLAGQHINVLMKQLLDIRTGKRNSPLMYPFVQARTIGGYQELSDVVAYLSTLPMNPKTVKGPWRTNSPEYKEGKKLYNEKCVACHGAKGEGNNALFYPRLNGQQYQYMILQLKKVKNKLRHVDPAMEQIVAQMSSKQLTKIINYISYLPVNKKLLAPSSKWRNPDFK